MRKLFITLLTLTSLYGACAHADRVSDYGEGLNSSDMLIAENRSALSTLFTNSFSPLFESLARKHNITRSNLRGSRKRANRTAHTR
jgi:hypothetical protein